MTQTITPPESVPATQPRVRLPRGAEGLLFLLRLAIGWHFLYEGVAKLLEVNWTSAGYLKGATGPLAGWFHGLAESATALKVVDQLNIWGLVLIGAALMLGLFTRLAAFAGGVLLALYYLAYPPFFGPLPKEVAEGHYLIVSKNLIEMVALALIIAVPVRSLGFDGLVAAWRRRRPAAPADDAPLPKSAPVPEPVEPPEPPEDLPRRHLLATLVGLPVAGAFAIAVLKRHGWVSYEERALASATAATKPDAVTGATIKAFDFSASLKDLKGQLPRGKIKNLELSRMILGGNLIGGWAHARDLIYADKLVKAYHTREKIFQTFQLAEACGVNTFLTSPLLCGIIDDYWKSTGGKIQFVSDGGGTPRELLDMIQRSIDHGAKACYVQGGIADTLVASGNYKLIEEALERIRKNGLPAGIGGHKFKTIVSCVEHGLTPDFWMKTFHPTNYWSARGEGEHDNNWCPSPDEVAAFMKERPEPWIAFKTLAAGAVHPRDGFRFAFEHGADFICVGMYDFQVIDDVNIALAVLNGKLERQRPWRA